MAKHAVIKSFYASEKWGTFRLLLINKRGNKCNHCKEIISRSRDLIGHHTIELTPENVHDHMISLNPELVEIVCFDCHNKIHRRFGYQNAKAVYIVYGPPLSGKTSFVRENMERGDLVVDLDMLSAAVSLQPTYDKPDNLFNNVISIHNLLLDNIKTRYGKWHDAWIIGGYADKYKRERLADELGAELIYCDVSQEECVRRLDLDEGRQFRKEEWLGYIDKWFAGYMK